jgi:alpha-N-acetylglucosaminidase
VIRRRSILGSAASLSAFAVLRGSTSAEGGSEPRPAAAPASAQGPAEAALRRVLPHHADQVDVVLSPGPGDWFRVGGRTGRITVEATSPASALTGVHWYLKYTAGVDVAWPGSSLSRLPSRLPAPGRELYRDAVVADRFAFNDTHEGYTGPYRGWTEWEREIDLLALHGVNEVLVTVGQEAVYHRALREFGYTGEELLAWFPAPGHQPWWLLQNMSAFGGPVPRHLLDAREELARRVLGRIRELGMRPVLPGWFGTVPNGFAERNPGAHTVPQGDWINAFPRPDWLDPRDEHFARLGESFYRHQDALYGTAGHYKMDLLHEGGTAGDVPVPDAARGVLAALSAARPEAVWVLLGWQQNPPREVVGAVERDRLLVVDGLSDRYEGLDREQRWLGAPYAFGTIHNFGGHTTLGANTGVWVERFPAWRAKPGSKLRGIALMPEGMGTNPAANELFAELAWRAGPTDHERWFAAYADRRYGGPDPHARAAWEVLRRTVYSMPDGEWSEAQDGLFAARPSLTASSAAAWSPKGMRYDAAAFEGALDELLLVDPRLRETDAYRFDVVDVARQALANRGRTLLPRIKAAFAGGDRAALRRLSGWWLDAMELLDDLLGSDARFMLGPWLEQARGWGADDAEAARLEFDARTIITVWGPRKAADDGTLHDYANREWAGLVRGFYLPRWRRFLDSLDDALASGGEPAPIDWFALEDAWTRGRERYATRPQGDPHHLATRVRDALRAGV